jgi:hypothetical protein
VPNALYGESVATAGDVNGDGYSDVIVGAPFYNDGEIEEGAAFVYLGAPSGVSAVAHWSRQSNVPETNLGWSVATAGDVNGDGYSDVIVGWPFDDPGGTAFVHHGSATGLSATAAWSANSTVEGGRYGFSVATAGDVNGDGFADVIVGAPGGYLQANHGAALVYLGGIDGLASGWSSRLETGAAGTWLGASVASAGDVNGDGLADVIVGAPLLHGGLAGPDAGAAFVHVSNSVFIEESPYWTLLGRVGGRFLGYTVASAGDVNGDGFDDILVAAPSQAIPSAPQAQASLFHGIGPPDPFSTGGLGGGMARGPVQRPTSVLAPLAPLGGTGALVDGVSLLVANARSPFGRSDVTLEWELRTPGSPFSGGDAAVTETGWTDSATQGTALEVRPEGLVVDQLFGWRLRIKYRPSTTPLAPHGPWLTSAVNELQGFDFRTELDTDADAVIDRLDNCKLTANASQRDSDADCIGNGCDADLNNSGGTVNFADLAIFRVLFGTVAPVADFNGSDGVVNFADLSLFRTLFGRPIGPSGLLPLSTLPRPGVCGP